MGLFDNRIHIEASRYVVVGLFATVLDIAVFNIVLSTKVFSDLDHISFIAKSVSTVIAVCVAYIGHRFWTFKHRSGSSSTRNQVGLFVLVNAIGLLIALTCLWVSRYIFGYTSQLSDNISANFVGLGLATAFRFLASRQFVFKA
jgi:putative flippase GtrA